MVQRVHFLVARDEAVVLSRAARLAKTAWRGLNPSWLLCPSTYIKKTKAVAFYDDMRVELCMAPFRYAQTKTAIISLLLCSNIGLLGTLMRGDR